VALVGNRRPSNSQVMPRICISRQKTAKGATNLNDCRVTAIQADDRSDIRSPHPGQIITDGNYRCDNHSW